MPTSISFSTTDKKDETTEQYDTKQSGIMLFYFPKYKCTLLNSWVTFLTIKQRVLWWVGGKFLTS